MVHVLCGEWLHISLAGWIGFLPVLEDYGVIIILFSLYQSMGFEIIISFMCKLSHPLLPMPRIHIDQRAQSWLLQNEDTRAKMVSMLKDRYQAWD